MMEEPQVPFPQGEHEFARDLLVSASLSGLLLPRYLGARGSLTRLPSPSPLFPSIPSVQMGFDLVCEFTEDGLRQSRDLVTFFRKRQAIELEYAKSLSMLLGRRGLGERTERSVESSLVL